MNIKNYEPYITSTDRRVKTRRVATLRKYRLPPQPADTLTDILTDIRQWGFHEEESGKNSAVGHGIGSLDDFILRAEQTDDYKCGHNPNGRRMHGQRLLRRQLPQGAGSKASGQGDRAESLDVRQRPGKLPRAAGVRRAQDPRSARAEQRRSAGFRVAPGYGTSWTKKRQSAFEAKLQAINDFFELP